MCSNIEEVIILTQQESPVNETTLQLGQGRDLGELKIPEISHPGQFTFLYAAHLFRISV